MHTLSWDVEYTDEFEEWWRTLSEEEQEVIDVAVEQLEVTGPTLGRPFVDQVKSSRHSRMKELIPLGSHIRILFAFDPRRTAILLIGGNKAGQWDKWYDRFVPVADKLYAEHMNMLKEGAKERRHAKDT